jgi:protoporphyrin/coproporphyrin ferrochelatase
MTYGVLVMAYGTPCSAEAIEPYYRHIRRGRAPTPELLAELTGRYEAIGGLSPLAERTEAQRAAIEAALDGPAVALGNKHAAPFVEDGAKALADAGADEVVGLVLAPHWSQAGVGQYHERAAAVAPGYRPIDDWSDLEPWLDFQVRAVRDGLATLPEGAVVLFTAHSLPERALVDDPYPDRLAASAEAIAGRAGVDRWELAWQSAGRTPEPWRGPDVLEVLRATDVPGVLVCPQGFTSDHLEVLYDLDIEAARVAAEAGVAFARTRSVNDDPAVMAGLADRIRAASGER